MTDHESLRAELASLTRQTQAYLQWLEDSGAEGIPTSSELKALFSVPAHQHAPRSASPPRERLAADSLPPQRRAASTAGAVASPEAHRSLAASSAPASRPEFDIPSTEEARHRRLKVLAEEVSNCTRCKLHEHRRNTAFSRGQPDAELVFVGEGPGREEDAQGLPFVGAAGQLLDRMIAAMGFERDEVYICNIVKCRPPRNRKPEPEEIEACAPYVHEQLALLSPKVIVALGGTGVQGLIGATTGITRMRGTWKLYRGRTPLMPTFHPAYLLRSPEKKRDVWRDLQEVMQRLGKTPPAKPSKPKS